VVSLLTGGELGFLGLFTRQLRISIKDAKLGEAAGKWPFADKDDDVLEEEEEESWEDEGGAR